MDWIDREELQLERAYERGDITLAEYNATLLELQRDVRDEQRERAQEAYDREMEK